MAIWPSRRPIQSKRRGFQKLEQKFAVLADNEQWLADNYQSSVSGAEQDRSNDVTIADEEEHVLRCFGAALIMQWNALPTKLQKEKQKGILRCLPRK
jgi:hypothetical protein